jgi:hypothetical protein
MAYASSGSNKNKDRRRRRRRLIRSNYLRWMPLHVPLKELTNEGR